LKEAVGYFIPTEKRQLGAKKDAKSIDVHGEIKEIVGTF